MAAVDADNIGEVLQKRYDWISLVEVLKQRYPGFPEDFLAKIVVKLNGNQQLIEDILSVQSTIHSVQMPHFAESTVVMTTALTTPNSFVQSSRSNISSIHDSDVASNIESAGSMYPDLMYPNVRPVTPNRRGIREDHSGLSSPVLGRGQVIHNPGRPLTGYQSHSFDGQSTPNFCQGRQFVRNVSGIGSNLSIVPENTLAVHSPSSDHSPSVSSGPVSLQSGSSMSTPYVGNSINLQLIKYNQMKKKVDIMRVDVERIRSLIAQEEEELLARSTVAKNPTSKDVNSLIEENQTLQQELLVMLKELDEFGEPFGDESGTTLATPYPSSNSASFTPAVSQPVGSFGEDWVLVRPSNPGARFPHVSLVRPTQPQPLPARPTLVHQRSGTALRTSPPPYERPKSYPPSCMPLFPGDSAAYGPVRRQPSTPADNFNIPQPNLPNVDINDDNEEKWRCRKCTYDNHIALNRCEICDETRE